MGCGASSLSPVDGSSLLISHNLSPEEATTHTHRTVQDNPSDKHGSSSRAPRGTSSPAHTHRDPQPERSTTSSTSRYAERLANEALDEAVASYLSECQDASSLMKPSPAHSPASALQQEYSQSHPHTHAPSNPSSTMQPTSATGHTPKSVQYATGFTFDDARYQPPHRQPYRDQYEPSHQHYHQLAVCTSPDIESALTSKPDGSPVQPTSTHIQYPHTGIPVTTQYSPEAIVSVYDGAGDGQQHSPLSQQHFDQTQVQFQPNQPFLFQQTNAPVLNIPYNDFPTRVPVGIRHNFSQSPISSEQNELLTPLPKAKQRWEMIHDTLGSGHFATVRKCRDRFTGELRAIKIIERDDKVTWPAVRDEIRVLRCVGKHRHIVELVDAFMDAKYFYLVMELCNGGDLFTRIVSGGRYSERDAARACRQLALALQHIHSKNVTHRDLKPENILLVDHSYESDLKVADFGLSKLVIGEASQMRTVCGTWAYCAPEVIRHESYTNKVDNWTLGVLLYILVAGYHPFDPFGTAPEPLLLDAITKCRYDFEDESWVHVSAAAQNLIVNLLRLDPVERMSLEDFLNSDWIRGAAREDDISSRLRSRLSSFRAGRRTQGQSELQPRLPLEIGDSAPGDAGTAAGAGVDASMPSSDLYGQVVLGAGVTAPGQQLADELGSDQNQVNPSNRNSTISHGSLHSVSPSPQPQDNPKRNLYASQDSIGGLNNLPGRVQYGTRQPSSTAASGQSRTLESINAAHANEIKSLYEQQQLEQQQQQQQQQLQHQQNQASAATLGLPDQPEPYQQQYLQQQTQQQHYQHDQHDQHQHYHQQQSQQL